MWSPTHVQVTVYRAKNLIAKGKSGTNDAYVTIKLGDEKYQTSIKERSVDPDWMEECDLPLTDPQSVVHLNVYHRNLLGIDEFLGHADISLEEFNIYERPRSRWYALRNKSGSKKPEKYRGEIEVKITFIVQSMTGSQTSLMKKGTVARSASIKALAQSVGDKLTKKWPSKGSLTLSGSRPDLSSPNIDTGDSSPTVRKLDKKGLMRSHTILPTSFNNQHLVETEQECDDVDGKNSKAVQGQDFDRWQNPLAPFRRKKKSRLSKMRLLSQSTHILDNTSEPPIEDIDNEGQDDSLAELRHRPMLAKSMFDLSTPSIEELAKDDGDTRAVALSAKEDICKIGDGQGHVKVQDHDLNMAERADGEGCDQTAAEPGLSDGEESTHYQERGVDVVFHKAEDVSGESSENDRGVLTEFCAAPSEKYFIKPPKPPRMSTPSTHVKANVETPHDEGPDKCDDDRQAEKSKTLADDNDHESQDTKMINQLETDMITSDTRLAEPSNTELAMKTDKKEQPLCYISSSGSDSTLSPESSPKKQTEQVSSTSKRQTEGEVKKDLNNKSDSDQRLATTESGQSLPVVKDRTIGGDRQKVEKYKKMKDVNWRHTLQYGCNNVARATAHDLHEGITEYQQRALENKGRELPMEVLKQFDDKSREDLIRMVLELNTQLHKKEQYNRDLENYIDNLLVKVMEVTPKLLQHPYSQSPSHNIQGVNNQNITNGLSSYGTSARSRMPVATSHSSHKKQAVKSNVDNVNNSNNRDINPEYIKRCNKTKEKPFNPFKKLQQALK